MVRIFQVWKSPVQERPALKNSTIGATYKVRKDEEARSWDDLTYWVKKFRFLSYRTWRTVKEHQIQTQPSLSSLAFQVVQGCGKE